MELRSLWASVRFTARMAARKSCCRRAAQRGLHLDHICPVPADLWPAVLPGNIGHYPPGSASAVRLHIQRGRSLFYSASPAAPGGVNGWVLQYLSHWCFGRRDWYGPSIMKA